MEKEYIKFIGVRKQRWRCPECGRAAPDDFCVVHGDVEPLDLTESAEAQLMATEIIKEEDKNVRFEKVKTDHGFHYRAIRQIQNV